MKRIDEGPFLSDRHDDYVTMTKNATRLMKVDDAVRHSNNQT